MKDLFTKNMFAVESNLSILQLRSEDVSEMTDRITLLAKQISKHESLYPGIEKWLKTKVLPGIKDESRVVYIGLADGNPVASSILKLGNDAKICHLHIDYDSQNRHLGELFFSMMALDAKRKAEKVHFTLPESLWMEKRSFFQSFGFSEAVKAHRQYRLSESELRSSVTFSVMWRHILEKLPKIIAALTPTCDSIFNGILMSIKAGHVKKIQNGNKVIEIRKRFNTKWQGCRVTIYSSSPDQAIYGYATIENVIKNTPSLIWSQYGDLIGSTKGDFDRYTGSNQQIYAILLRDFEPYLNPVYLSQISYLLNDKQPRPPESYLALENNIEWSRAVSVAELLHNRFWLYNAVI